MASGYPDYTGQVNPQLDYPIDSFSTSVTISAGTSTYSRSIISGKFMLRWIEAKINKLDRCLTLSIYYFINGETCFYYNPISSSGPRINRYGDTPGLLYHTDIKRNDAKGTMFLDLYFEGELTELITVNSPTGDTIYKPYIAYQVLT